MEAVPCGHVFSDVAVLSHRGSVPALTSIVRKEFLATDVRVLIFITRESLYNSGCRSNVKGGDKGRCFGVYGTT